MCKFLGTLNRGMELIGVMVWTTSVSELIWSVLVGISWIEVTIGAEFLIVN